MCWWRRRRRHDSAHDSAFQQESYDCLVGKRTRERQQLVTHDVSDWLVNADVSDLCRPPAVSRRCTRSPEDSSTFRTSTITCYLPRLPASSHDYLLPPTTASSQPSLMTTQNVTSKKDTIRKSTCLLGRVAGQAPNQQIPVGA
jgi:hypothetical protein